MFLFLLFENSSKNSNSFFFLLTRKLLDLCIKKLFTGFSLHVTLALGWACVGMSVDWLWATLPSLDYSQKNARGEGEYYIFSIVYNFFLKVLHMYRMWQYELCADELGYLQANHLIYTNVQNTVLRHHGVNSCHFTCSQFWRSELVWLSRA